MRASKAIYVAATVLLRFCSAQPFQNETTEEFRSIEDFNVAVASIGSVSGSCSSGQIFTVTSYADLLRQSSDLMCIFASGVVPDGVPSGFVYGRMVSFSNTAKFNSLINNHYQGDFIYQTLCQGQPVFLGEVKFDGISVGVGEMKIDSLSLRSDEYFDHRSDGKDGMIYEFDYDLYHRCRPDQRTNFPLLFFATNLAGPLTNTYPTKIFTDVIRVVGRSEDGGLLLLGRTFVRDPAQINSKLTTAYFFLLKTFDPTINADFLNLQQLPPLMRGFTYRLPGIPNLVLKANPFHYLLALFLQTERSKMPSAILAALIENKMLNYS